MSSGVVQPLVAVVGPTAAGKSGLGVDLARALGGEVVNADSMQLYRGMDIGTAKLTLEERQGIPHHLLDVWDVTTTADVATYQSLARAAVDDIRAAAVPRSSSAARGSTSVHSSTTSTSPGPSPRCGPSSRPSSRRSVRRRCTYGSPRSTPRPPPRSSPTNGRRVVRALEVVALRGRFVARLPQPQAHQPTVLLGLDVPRDAARRADRRCGWTRCGRPGSSRRSRGSEDAGLRDGRTASRALGYAQVLRQLDGELSEDAAREETVRATRRFARRQLSWFRRDERIRWLTYDSPDLLDQALASVV